MIDGDVFKEQDIVLARGSTGGYWVGVVMEFESAGSVKVKFWNARRNCFMVNTLMMQASGLTLVGPLPSEAQWDG